jgi:hypothetical protein
MFGPPDQPLAASASARALRTASVTGWWSSLYAARRIPSNGFSGAGTGSE